MRGPTGLKVSAKRSRQHGHGARYSSAACSPWHLSRPLHTPYRRLGVVWNFDRQWRNVPRVCGPWTVLPCCGNSALPIAVPSRFVAPSSGNAPDIGNDVSQRGGSANRAKRIARKARYLHHHESCQQNPSHLAKKNARIASRCAQCDVHAAVLRSAVRLHHL